jgi:hypothetical protein
MMHRIISPKTWRPTISIPAKQLQRSFTTSHHQKNSTPNPASHQPASHVGKHREEQGMDTPNTDPQSSASKDEQLSGDDHPAKQPDPQQTPDRSTGFGGQTGVDGGKKGLDARDDK